MNKPPEIKKEHELSIIDRKRMQLSGVLEVHGFDDVLISLKTEFGELQIEGEGLKIGLLDTEKGHVSVEGTINGLLYTDSMRIKKRGRFGRA